MTDSLLERALELSKEVRIAAEQGDVRQAATLDAQRLALLKSVSQPGALAAPQLSMLREIAALNGQSIELMEHHLRIKGRQMDLAAFGRRAVSAYATTRLPR